MLTVLATVAAVGMLIPLLPNVLVVIVCQQAVSLPSAYHWFLQQDHGFPAPLGLPHPLAAPTPRVSYLLTAELPPVYLDQAGVMTLPSPSLDVGREASVLIKRFTESANGSALIHPQHSRRRQ